MRSKKVRAGATGEKPRRPLLERGDGFTALSLNRPLFPRKRGESNGGGIARPAAVFTVNDAAQGSQVSKGL